MKKKNHSLISALIVTFFSWIPGICLSQLDSTFISVGLGENAFDQLDTVTVTLTFDDIADVGYVNIVVYDDQSNAIVREVRKTRTELDLEGYLFPDRIEYPLFLAFAEHTYRIEISPKNLEGAYTSLCFYTLVH